MLWVAEDTRGWGWRLWVCVLWVEMRPGVQGSQAPVPPLSSLLLSPPFPSPGCPLRALHLAPSLRSASVAPQCQLPCWAFPGARGQARESSSPSSPSSAPLSALLPSTHPGSARGDLWCHTSHASFACYFHPPAPPSRHLAKPHPLPSEQQARSRALEPAWDAQTLCPTAPGTRVHASLLQGQGTGWGR